jgi:hypothetical protein
VRQQRNLIPLRTLFRLPTCPFRDFEVGDRPRQAGLLLLSSEAAEQRLGEELRAPAIGGRMPGPEDQSGGFALDDE